MHIGITDAGHVGLVTEASLAVLGLFVICVGRDLLGKGNVPFHERH